MKVNAIVLNYNGKDLLEAFLPSVIEAAASSVYPCKVTVLDNCSRDGSVEFVKERFPNVIVYEASQNKVLCSYNEIAKVIDDDIIVLLNNDIRLAKDFFDPIIDNFKHSNRILFVAARGYSVNGEVYEGDHSIPKLRWGIIESSIDFSDQEALINKRGYSFSAGVAAFDRHKFLALGGYDELYLPGRYEDVDLCYRGWKKGYIGLYEPRSVQYHQGGSSFKRNYTQKETAALVFRNSILFTLKNITDIALLFRFFMFTLLRLFYYLSAGKWFFIRAFFEALKRLPLALKRRKHAKKEFLLSDKEVRLKIKDNFVLNTEVRF